MSSTGHTQNPSPESTADNRATLEVERLHLEVEKLKLEVQAIRSPSFWERYISRIVPLITAVIAVGGFYWGINVHVAQQRENERQREQTERQRIALQEETARQRIAQQQENERQRAIDLKREAAKPFWDTQLKLYIRAVEAASTIAIAKDANVRAAAEKEFWTLYWGPLAAIEDVGSLRNVRTVGAQDSTTEENVVEAAMVCFSKLLKASTDNRDQHNMEQAALHLAHAIRTAAQPAFDLHVEKSGNFRGVEPIRKLASGGTLLDPSCR